EDDEDDFLLVRDLFDELPPGSYALDRVGTFDDAVRAVKNCHHDVYLVDYRLGAHTGIELVQHALASGCKAPLIMLTGQHEREIDVLAMQAGAVDFLLKDGLDADGLERSMRYALAQKQFEDAICQANQQLELRVHQRTAELNSLNEALQAEIAERKRAE